MSQKIIFHVDLRDTSSHFSNSQRKHEVLLGNIFGLHQPSQAVRIPKKAFTKLYAKEGDTGLIYLKINEGDKEEPVLIDEVQAHPVTGDLIHASFRRVNLKEEIEAEIEVMLVGENEVKGATVLLVLDTITVKALPANLPEKFEVDVTKLLEVGQSITVGDLSYDSQKVQLVLGEMTNESPIAILQEVKEEVVEEVAAPADVEIAEKGKEESDATDGATTASKSQE